MDATHSVDEACQPRGGDTEQRSRRVVLPVEHRPRCDPGERAFQPVAGGHRGKHDVRIVEIDRQPLCPDCDVAEHRAARELLEEVLDQVLLREALDHLDLLDSDRDLVRDGAREIELRRAMRDESAK